VDPDPGQEEDLTLTRRLRDTLLAAAVVAALLSVVLALFTARVEGISMWPTLREGDALLVDKVGVHYSAPKRGDIVVALEPAGAMFVKRVIAEPGDAIEIDSGGPQPVVLIRPGSRGAWQRLEEPYAANSWNRKDFCCNRRGLDVGVTTPQALQVPPDRFFLLGDNRDASTDSRRYGLFTRDQIVGRVLFRWWPLTQAGAIYARPTLVPG